MPEIAFYLFIEDQIFASQEIWWVKLTPLWVTFSLPISCKQFKIPSVSETILTLFSLFFGGPGLRHSSRFIQHSKTVQFPKSDQGWGRDFTGEADTITGQLLVTYLLHTVQDPFCTATQFSFENSFHTPLFVFWWFKIHSAQQDSPVCKIRSRLRKRLYGWGWHHYRSAIGHLSLTHSSRSILHSDTVQFRKQFSHSSLCFLVDQVLAHRSRLRKRLYGWSWLQSRSAVSHLSLTHSSRSILHSDTVEFRKQFSHSSICFLVDQVLASQIKAVEETLWAKLTPLQVSHYSPISYTQFKIRSVQQDSPVSKQFSHSFLCFLVD